MAKKPDPTQSALFLDKEYSKKPTKLSEPRCGNCALRLLHGHTDKIIYCSIQVSKTKGSKRVQKMGTPCGKWVDGK